MFRTKTKKTKLKTGMMENGSRIQFSVDTLLPSLLLVIRAKLNTEKIQNDLEISLFEHAENNYYRPFPDQYTLWRAVEIITEKMSEIRITITEEKKGRRKGEPWKEIWQRES